MAPFRTLPASGNNYTTLPIMSVSHDPMSHDTMSHDTTRSSTNA